ncbi:hypothetical protein [Pseudoalteromonas phenolica]|uniref:Uncharacterized protein n=1 Tax=Pseudoalteromonas phenolica TaxID=161398 RepID=A0A0S2K6E2_9GAMM|nr:hypothetical protein [Pseudoalteromonas phenolica]ALO43837.1 hypothetical protein PP2015_3362 [Pseudoalteromonas phenolica]RXF04802.1 hypothetical protein D9981_03785 [Pseudoalteromonas phenolica O-BC30]
MCKFNFISVLRESLFYFGMFTMYNTLLDWYQTHSFDVAFKIEVLPFFFILAMVNIYCFYRYWEQGVKKKDELIQK